MLRLYALLLLMPLACLPFQRNSVTPIPNVNLNVAVRQMEDGKLGDGIHLMNLVCVARQCTLTTLSLNQCFPDPIEVGKEAFSTAIETTQTAKGTLKVRVLGDNTLEAIETDSDVGGEGTTRFLFGYDPKNPTRLISFSGSFVKTSSILNRVLTVSYVPLAKPYQVVPLSCGVRLPGVVPLTPSEKRLRQ